MQFQKIAIPPLPQKGLEFPQGWGGSVRPKHLKKCMNLNWNFQRGGEGVLEKILPWGRYGYFMELHIHYSIKPVSIKHGLRTTDYGLPTTDWV